MIRVPRRLAMVIMSIGGLFGMRTPPDPPVVAQTSPAPGPRDVPLNLAARDLPPETVIRLGRKPRRDSSGPPDDPEAPAP